MCYWKFICLPRNLDGPGPPWSTIPAANWSRWGSSASEVIIQMAYTCWIPRESLRGPLSSAVLSHCDFGFVKKKVIPKNIMPSQKKQHQGTLTYLGNYPISKQTCMKNYHGRPASRLAKTTPFRTQRPRAPRRKSWTGQGCLLEVPLVPGSQGFFYSESSWWF